MQRLWESGIPKSVRDLERDGVQHDSAFRQTRLTSVGRRGTLEGEMSTYAAYGYWYWELGGKTAGGQRVPV